MLIARTRVLWTFSLVLLLAGCLPAPVEPPAATPPAATATAEPPAATATTEPPVATATAEPPAATAEPTAPAETAVPAPTEVPEEEAERIRLGPGTTDARVEGDLAARESVRYVLAAREGDLLEVEVSAPEPGVRLVIFGEDGTVLRSGMAEGSLFRGTLPATQDYTVLLDAAEAALSYSMLVSLPERIAFDAGATSAEVEGEVAPFERHAYVAGLAEGQTLEVEVTAPAPGVRLVIYGLDGTVLRSGMGEGAAFQGPVPVTQDYILAVSAGEEGVPYTLSLSAR